MPRKMRTRASEKGPSTRRRPEPTARAARGPAQQARDRRASARALDSPSNMLATGDVLALQRTVGNSAVEQVLGAMLGQSGDASAPALQRRAGEALQAKGAARSTGLPDNLKSGVEALSGLSMDDVRVHYNSDKPAQVQALAYTQGSEIFVAPSQEKHLPHEAWHVAQQKQGRVKPTLQARGVAINDDHTLEREADAMGARALNAAQGSVQMKSDGQAAALDRTKVIHSPAIQLTVDTAAQALFSAGEITVKKKHFTKAFNAQHAVTQADLKAIQTKLTELRDADKDKRKVEVVDITIPANRPTEGGMTEGDAAILADLNGWTQVTTDFTCTDISHTPKGKVYKNDSGAYFGADKDGHVGWGFKVWTKKDKTTLIYQGNMVWDGTAWQHISRGTS